MNKLTEEKTVNCKHQQQRLFMWNIRFFGFFQIPTDKPIIVSNCKELLYKIKTDGNDLTHGLEGKKLL